MSAFWNFSVRLYAQDGVKPACLALQAGGMDVNVGLWIVWSCVNGRDPGPALGQAVELSSLWSAQVVKPLRSARDHLKHPMASMEADAARALRKSVLAAELEAEKLEQHALEALTQSCPETGDMDRRDLALKRLQDYAARLGSSAACAGQFVENVFETTKNV
ncbi:TIGR02444 family protein [Oceanicaulis sp. MMSF_3324]|uniref:TIGR02444 family protein n=1 Tax=Oceanicaulis sp. MMSF_3324 TaxID=3046702 RepID=UPI00273E5661|nr:TIGR02444 family protein [Oceanicaulis sp. MMSF_3324]